MPIEVIPKSEMRDGELWVCLGPNPPANYVVGILRIGDWQKLRDEMAANELKRFKYILDNMNDFANYLQWRGNPPEAGSFLPPANPWLNDPEEPNAKSR